MVVPDHSLIQTQALGSLFLLPLPSTPTRGHVPCDRTRKDRSTSWRYVGALLTDLPALPSLSLPCPLAALTQSRGCGLLSRSQTLGWPSKPLVFSRLRHVPFGVVSESCAQTEYCTERCHPWQLPASTQDHRLRCLQYTHHVNE